MEFQIRFQKKPGSPWCNVDQTVPEVYLADANANLDVDRGLYIAIIGQDDQDHRFRTLIPATGKIEITVAGGDNEV